MADSVLQALNVSRTRPIRTATPLTGKDQRTYAEAIGLLQRIRDVKSLDRAIQSLEGLLGNARDSAAVNGTLGKALLRKFALTNERALVDQAAVYAERAVLLDPSEPEAQITLGELQRTSGKFPEAVTSFQRALALQPESIDARLGLADAYNSMGRAADAEHLFDSALQLRPDYPDAFGRYGRFSLAHGRFDDAIRLFTKQTQLLPDAPRAWSNLGIALSSAGRYEEAIRALQHSLTLEPTRGAYVNLGTCYFWLGRYAEAAVAYERAAALEPKQYIVWADLGDGYRWAPGMRAKSLGAYDEAIRLTREALAINPRDVLARTIEASCLAKRGNAVLAQREINLALRDDPTNGKALYEAAVIASIRGDRDAAFAWMQRAIAAGASATDAKHDPELSSIYNKPQV